VATQSDIAVTAAAASTFQLVGHASVSAGGSYTLTITAYDAYGNVATGYTGTVAFKSSDRKAILPANYTFTAADAGTHTFTIVFETAGSQSVTATDTSKTKVKGTKSGILVR
jgi:hypothetical protein